MQKIFDKAIKYNKNIGESTAKTTEEFSVNQAKKHLLELALEKSRRMEFGINEMQKDSISIANQVTQILTNPEKYKEIYLPTYNEKTIYSGEPYIHYTPKVVKKGMLFAQSVLDRWQNQLSNMGQDEEFLEKTGLSSDWFAETAQELIKGVSRMEIEKKISDISEEALYSPNPSIFLRRIASETSSILNNYIISLGQKINEPPIPSKSPKVTLSAASYPGINIYKNWAISFVKLFTNNVAVATAEDEAGNKVLKEILQMPY